MTAAARAQSSSPVLRTAAGEPPLGIGGLAFRDDQGEIFENDNERYRTPAARIGLLELEDGRWLAHPPGFRADLPVLFKNRDAALRYAINEVVRRARRYMRNGEGEGTHWTEGYAGRVIEWALSLKPRMTWKEVVLARMASEEINPPASEDNDLSEKTASQEITDPVVAELVAAHRLRRQFPASHIFSMTTAIIDGRACNVATCGCGHVLKFIGGDQLRMDAAIEAHWRRFSYDKMVDGRGIPITPGDASRIPSAKKPRKRKEPGAVEGIPAPLASAPEAGEPDGADAVVLQPAPIGAGSAEPQDDWSPLLSDALGLAWRELPQVSASLAALLDFSKVYTVPKAVERPVLRWHGGKWLLAPWIISHFPPHRIYVEPFGGAGSVLLRKPRAYAEIWNDLDDAIVNLFRVLRSDRAHELVEHLRLTPFARSEFDETSAAWPTDAVERARHLVVRAFMGFGSNAHGRSTGFRANSNRSGTTPAHDWAGYPDCLLAVIDRLSGVVVENRDATRVMQTHDSAETLHYVDPPYVWGTRGDDGPGYTHEMDDAAHAALLSFIPTLNGMVVLSGYPSPMYDDALPDWRRIEREALADGARKRTEVLWLNPACAQALDELHPPLFDIAALDAVNIPPPSTI